MGKGRMMAYYQMQIHDVSKKVFDNILDSFDEEDLLGSIFQKSWYDRDDDAGFLQGESDEEWYDQDDVLKRISQDFPQAVFRLSTVAEECSYHDYYSNGNGQRCPVQIRFVKPLTIKWRQI